MRLFMECVMVFALTVSLFAASVMIPRVLLATAIIFATASCAIAVNPHIKKPAVIVFFSTTLADGQILADTLTQVESLIGKGYPVKAVDFDKLPKVHWSREWFAVGQQPTWAIFDRDAAVAIATQQTNPPKDAATKLLASLSTAHAPLKNPEGWLDEHYAFKLRWVTASEIPRMGSTKELGEKYPHIVMDGERLEYRADKQHFYYAGTEEKAMWMEMVVDGKPQRRLGVKTRRTPDGKTEQFTGGKWVASDLKLPPLPEWKE